MEFPRNGDYEHRETTVSPILTGDGVNANRATVSTTLRTMSGFLRIQQRHSRTQL